MVNYKTVLDEAKAKCVEMGFEPSRAEWLMLDLFHWSKSKFILHLNDDVPNEHLLLFNTAKERMLTGEPIQYIVGFQSFYGETFKVNQHCLIPRPETEEVMLHFFKQLNHGDCVVDIGTGSGNIPVTLKMMDETLEVYATDLYSEPLMVAKENAQLHQVDVQFLQGDTLEPLITQGIKVNGLISNPPYIDDDEATLMNDTVLKYEPHYALFAEEKGYKIYEKILDQLPEVLLPQAKVVFEIGFKQGPTLKQKINAKYPLLDVHIIKDINGNDRIISFEW